MELLPANSEPFVRAAVVDASTADVDADDVGAIDDERSLDVARPPVPFKWLLFALSESTVESVNDLERDNSQFGL